jgi:transitional endoplasmic reticulum ATPase
VKRGTPASFLHAASFAPSSLDSVGGLWEPKRQLREACLLSLRHPALLAHLGLPTSQGILLHGPTGSGKTFIVQALVKEMGCHAEMVSCPEVAASDSG